VAKNKLYRGISFTSYEDNKSLSQHDIELVKIDIMNHIFTSLGERIMMPTFGTRIPDLLFEPLDQQTLDVIYEDLTTVINYDPRVIINEDDISGGGIRLEVAPDEKFVTAYVSLYYVELDLSETLEINLEFNQ
jgi:phage baseplate assembly protein W